MTIATISAAEARRKIDAGARLVDIRDHDEHARENIPGALNMPLSQIDSLPPNGEPIIFHCRSGMRTAANADLLANAARGVPCYVVQGGIDAWRRAGLPVSIDRKQPLEIMRQVQLGAGGLVLLSVALGFLLGPGFFALSALVGAGLILAGVTGWCGMASLLRHMPWNRPSQGA